MIFLCWCKGSIPTVVRHIFQACPVWIYTQSNITSIIFIMLVRSIIIRDHSLFMTGGGLAKKGVGHEVFLTEKGGAPKNIGS